MRDWLTVDTDGLRRRAERTGRSPVLELLANAWDSDATEVLVTLQREGRLTTITVTDNGRGLSDINDVHTLFGQSAHGANPERRGRFGVGEKIFLSLCEWCQITSRDCAVEFGPRGRRNVAARHDGTIVHAELRQTEAQYAAMVEAIRACRAPAATTTTLIVGNLRESIPAMVGTVIRATLPTEIESDGVLRRSIRVTDVQAVAGDGVIREMGIPCGEIDLPFDLDVGQKVPQTIERDGSMTAAFNAAIRVAVLNALAPNMTTDDLSADWATSAASDGRATAEAVGAVIRAKFGTMAVAATVGSPGSNATAEARGYTVVHGGAMPPGLWSNARKAGLLQSSASVFPQTPPAVLAAAAEAASAVVAAKCPLCGRSE